jgi:hypothetical protein
MATFLVWPSSVKTQLVLTRIQIVCAWPNTMGKPVRRALHAMHRHLLHSLANFQADCSNVNAKCKIECGQGVATTPDDEEEGGSDDSTLALTDTSVIAEATKEVCLYPARSIIPSPTPTTESSPSSSNVANQQLKSTACCWTFSVLVASLFYWIY